MYVADQLLQVIAKTRHQELLDEAEKWRLAIIAGAGLVAILRVVI